MAITGDNEYNIRDIPGSDYCWSDDLDPIDLNAVVRLYLIVSCVLRLIGVFGLIVLFLVL